MNDLFFPALAENVEKKCVYVIKDGPELMGIGDESCRLTNIEKELSQSDTRELFINPFITI